MSDPAVPSSLLTGVRRVLRPTETPQTAAAVARRSARGVARRLVGPLVQRVVDRVARQVNAGLRDEVARVAETSFGREIDALRAESAVISSRQQRIENEMVRTLTSLDSMADAIAPTAGLAGVAERYSELRVRLNAVERRTRTTTAAAPQAAATPAGSPRVASEVIDYTGLERRFRGRSEQVTAILEERYLGLLREHGPVLDIGCGRGELLAVLRSHGVAARGVDSDHGMSAEAQAQGLDVTCSDALDYLRDVEPGSLGAVIAVHVVEHVPIAYLVQLLELVHSRLRPGGIFVAETPNPQTLIVLGTHFILDPTHLRPIHPALMVYLAECAGFGDVRLDFYSPATEQQLPLLDENEGPWVPQLNQSLSRLNSVLFGPQEYAAVATKPEATA